MKKIFFVFVVHVVLTCLINTTAYSQGILNQDNQNLIINSVIIDPQIPEANQLFNINVELKNIGKQNLTFDVIEAQTQPEGVIWRLSFPNARTISPKTSFYSGLIECRPLVNSGKRTLTIVVKSRNRIITQKNIEIKVRNAAGPLLSITNVIASPINQNQGFTVTATVRNSGNAEGRIISTTLRAQGNNFILQNNIDRLVRSRSEEQIEIRSPNGFPTPGFKNMLLIIETADNARIPPFPFVIEVIETRAQIGIINPIEINPNPANTGQAFDILTRVQNIGNEGGSIRHLIVTDNNFHLFDERPNEVIPAGENRVITTRIQNGIQNLGPHQVSVRLTDSNNYLHTSNPVIIQVQEAPRPEVIINSVTATANINLRDRPQPVTVNIEARSNNAPSTINVEILDPDNNRLELVRNILLNVNVDTRVPPITTSQNAPRSTRQVRIIITREDNTVIFDQQIDIANQ
ncbi:MAG: hypothetical protein AB1755_00655 [Candidatus Omnitrophota bacterium]